jgi:hypothetical protein
MTAPPGFGQPRRSDAPLIGARQTKTPRRTGALNVVAIKS